MSPTQKQSSARKPEKLANLIRALEVIAGGVATLIMIAGFVMGFWIIGKSLGEIAVGALDASQAVQSVLGGVEWFFLAPLPLVSIQGIVRFFRKNHAALIEAKRLVFGQIVAVAATNLLERLAANDDSVTWRRSAAAVGLIVAVSVYLLVTQLLGSAKSEGKERRSVSRSGAPAGPDPLPHNPPASS